MIASEQDPRPSAVRNLNMRALHNFANGLLTANETPALAKHIAIPDG
jgi:hypothetical protein